MKKILVSGFACMCFQFAASQNCSVTLTVFQPSGTCEGMAIQLIAGASAPGLTFAWNCPNPVYNSTTGPFLWIPCSSLADAGAYTVTVTDTAGCVAVNQAQVPVTPKPVVHIYGQGFACQGTKTPLYAMDLAGNYGPYQYLWDNGLSTSMIKVTHNGGAYPHPSCTMTNAAGCWASNQTSFMIGTLYPPVATIGYSGLTAFCSPGNLNLTCTTPVSPQMSYQWKKNGQVMQAATSSYFKATATGNYKVVVTDMNGCSGISDVVPVTVYPRPSGQVTASGPLAFCPGDSVVLSAVSGSGYTYQWRKNGVPLPGATGLNYSASSSGNYKVEVTNNQDCYRLSDKIAVNADCRSMQYDPEKERLVQVFPNPSSADFSVSLLQSPSGQTVMEIFDPAGRLMEQFTVYPSEQNLVFGNGLLPGFYLLRVRTGDRQEMIRLVKE